VPAAAVPSTSAVPTRCIVPSGHLLAPLRYEHISRDGHSRDGHSATASLSTPLFDHHRHSGWHHTRMPAPLRLRRGRQCHPMPAPMPTGWRNEQHDDDRLPTALPGERHHCAQRQSQRGLLSSAVPAPLHGRPGLSDDRLPHRPAIPAASVPHLQRKQPLLSVSRAPEQRLR
jgi:hypothetical protein